MSAVGPAVYSRLAKELRELSKQPCEGIRVLVNEDNITDLRAELEGPAGTPYEGGLFRMKLVLGEDFPTAPPKGFFTTKIFHPNVSKAGEICVNVLKRDWTEDMGLRHVLVVIRCLLIEPFPESALNEEAGRLLMEDYEQYASHARLMTSIHAQQTAKRPTPLTASGGANAVNSGSAEKDGSDPGSPAVKKSKAITDKAKAKAAAAKKRSLKRL
jgi:ubiquitin-conjugating enzyme E2 S